MWFESLTGVSNETSSNIRSQLYVEGEYLGSRISGCRWKFGRLETPTLAELRLSASELSTPEHGTTLAELVGDIQGLHGDPRNQGAMFQVASQFNLLEMASPRLTPEDGVGIYERDRTQGPACAIAVGAGTIYRNYFVPLGHQTGQSATRQIDCLEDLGFALGNTNERLWKMCNGYAIPTPEGLREVYDRLNHSSDSEIDALRQKLRIGLQLDAQVTLSGCQHTVSQAYCSALPIAYCGFPEKLWEPFARLVLDSAYEATLLAAAIHTPRENRQLFLTLLGGGAFGNPMRWIIDAIERAIRLTRNHRLNVTINSFREPQPEVTALIQRLNLNP